MATAGHPRLFNVDSAVGQALMLFWEYGYEATAGSVAFHDGNSRLRVLYTAFGSKEALFERVLDRYIHDRPRDRQGRCR